MNHYEYMDIHLPKFFEDTKVNGGWEWNAGIISAHGDKFYGYQSKWEDAGIHFHHGCMIMMLTYCNPYGKETRDNVKDVRWVDPSQWVIDNYNRFKKFLPPLN
jgi:hypothetical protein